ncbi:hypothetical protein [Thioalkalivibrio thiocyanodenitrificans]|uniref:hypothetical protein n=1 Tax=Thioalkalivibrio thiocyanodenitrificans TaxID=243063 RepID=UPI000476939D|nr:hypothetical protein [Thioalkalivibrio thiocyanodenitrificans]
MSMVGFLVIMPKTLEVSAEAVEAKRLEQLKYAEPVLTHYLANGADDELTDEAVALFEEHVLSDDLFTKIDNSGDIETLLERLRSTEQYAKWVDSLKTELESGLDNCLTAWRDHPDNSDELLVFTGDATWGDSPEHQMYEALSTVFGYHVGDLFGIR